jgi:hypothetical protein
MFAGDATPCERRLGALLGTSTTNRSFSKIFGAEFHGDGLDLSETPKELVAPDGQKIPDTHLLVISDQAVEFVVVAGFFVISIVNAVEETRRRFGDRDPCSLIHMRGPFVPGIRAQVRQSPQIGGLLVTPFSQIVSEALPCSLGPGIVEREDVQGISAL